MQDKSKHCRVGDRGKGNNRAVLNSWLDLKNSLRRVVGVPAIRKKREKLREKVKNG